MILDNPSQDKTLSRVEYNQTNSMKILSCISATTASLFDITDGSAGVR